MAIITSLTKGYEGRDVLSGEAASTDELFSMVYRVVDQETGCGATCSLLLDQGEAISLECLLKKDLNQRGERCETLRHGDVVLACTPGALPLISFPKRSLSIRLWRDDDYTQLLCMLAETLHDPDADCPCDYERERD